MAGKQVQYRAPSLPARRPSCHPHAMPVTSRDNCCPPHHPSPARRPLPRCFVHVSLRLLAVVAVPEPDLLAPPRPYHHAPIGPRRAVRGSAGDGRGVASRHRHHHPLPSRCSIHAHHCCLSWTSRRAPMQPGLGPSRAGAGARKHRL
jgi:hypothetical protein